MEGIYSKIYQAVNLINVSLSIYMFYMYFILYLQYCLFEELVYALFVGVIFLVFVFRVVCSFCIVMFLS